MTEEQRDALIFMLSLIGLSGDPRVTKAHKVLRAMVSAPTQGADAQPVVTDTREQFEAHWCRDVPAMYRIAALAEIRADRDAERYKRDEIQWAWESWQAALATRDAADDARPVAIYQLQFNGNSWDDVSAADFDNWAPNLKPEFKRIVYATCDTALIDASDDVIQRIKKAVGDYWGETSPEGLALNRLIAASAQRDK